MKRNIRSPWLLNCLVLAAGFILGSASAADQQAMKNARYEIAYATYLGGDQWDQAREVIPCPDGTVLIGGMTSSSNMPMTPGVVQPKYAGDDPSLGHGGVIGGDAFLVRLNTDGTRIVAATYFGGSKQERGVYGMLLDSQGNIVIGSATRSSDMPTTKGAYQTKYGGGEADMYAAKLSADMKKILWCTYVGGSQNDWPRGGLALDSQDNVYLVGGANSKDFPTTRGAFQQRLKGERNAAIVKLSADGSKPIFSTFLGGSIWDSIMGVRVDRSGDVYVAGHTRSPDFPVTPGAPQSTLGGKSDCFLAKLSNDGSRLIYSTYLGGVENEFAEHRPLLGRDGTFFLTGVTSSPDFPTTTGAFQRILKGNNDGFVTKLSSEGRSFGFSSLLGGSGGEFLLMPTLDGGGNILVVGHTTSSDFPITSDALQTAYRGGKGVRDGDGLLAVLSPDGSKLVYATFLGGSGDDLIRSVAIGPNREVYLVGSTSSRDFPATSNAVQPQLAGSADAFVVKLVPVEQ
ncbi:MAG: SBBP repeat-containing protein [Planctomycetota bacterium]